MADYDFSKTNFTGFDNATIDEIKKDCLRFLEYKADVEEKEIDGSYGL